MTIEQLEKRVSNLLKTRHKIPTFEEFQEEWEHMDSLSQSLYLHDVAAQENAGDKFLLKIGAYLAQMGVEMDNPFSLREMARELTSDA